MGLTYREANNLGLGNLHPDRPRGRPPGGRPNRTEQRFLDFLELTNESRRREHEFPIVFRAQALNLRLGPRTWYRPDVYVYVKGSFHTPDVHACIEIKAGRKVPAAAGGWKRTYFSRDKGIVKLKVAAGLYPWLSWFLVCPDGDGWQMRTVGPAGIGPPEDEFPW
jgi:hypothetical protein